LSIKKYNTYCFNHHHKEKRELKTNSKILFSKRGLLSVIAITIVLILAGMKLFLDIPKISERLSISGEKSEEIFWQAAKNDSEFEEPNISEPEKKESAEETTKYEDEFSAVALNLERLDLERLNLRYQEVNKEMDIKKFSGMLNSGETVYEHLVKAGILPTEILRLGEKVQSIVDISRLNAGTRFAVHYNSEGKIVQFDYQPNQLDTYYIKIPDNELSHIEVIKEEIFREIVCIEGEIESSLYQAMINHCNSGQLAIQLAEIFAWDIDFLTECQQGDTFKILVERLYRGDFYRWGDIMAAVYEGEMLSSHTAVLFQDPSGNIDYYDKDGRCLRKAFLRAPLNYKYISSHYTESRYHPILRIWRPHLAIDYAAPTGTPVVAIGAGTVISRYYDKGGYGNYVEIKHPNGYVTGYGHLSKFAQGLQVGKRVNQGEIIGYVGATGLATGPHLDFSISKEGKRINFLELKLPPASSVGTEYREDFDLVKKNYLSILKEEL